MDPLTFGIMVLMMTAIVIALTGRRGVQPPMVVVPTQPVSQSGSGAAGFLVLLAAVLLFFYWVPYWS